MLKIKRTPPLSRHGDAVVGVGVAPGTEPLPDPLVSAWYWGLWPGRLRSCRRKDPRS
jgi:hypothetical protein